MLFESLKVLRLESFLKFGKVFKWGGESFYFRDIDVERLGGKWEFLKLS